MKRYKSITTILLSTVVLWSVAPTHGVFAQRLSIPPVGSSPAPSAMSPSVVSPSVMSPDPYATSTPGLSSGSSSGLSTPGASASTYGSSVPGSPYSAAADLSTPYPSGSALSAAPVTSGSVLGPTATYQAQPAIPSPGWDPFSAPGAETTAPSLLPTDFNPALPTWDPRVQEVWRQRLRDELRLDYYFIPARGAKRFGINDLDLSVTLAFPFMYNEKTPIKVTPGFAFHWWEGPVSNQLPPGSSLNYLPPRVYDAYLDTAWNPQLRNTPIGAELAFRIGVYSDFKKLTAESLRYTGHGLMVVTLSPALKAKLGIVYYDRVKVKMLPAGGLVWTPNDDLRLDILFPNPMFSRRMTTTGTIDIWMYLRGEYGGGSWVLTPAEPMANIDQYDYNDLRAALGFEFDNTTQGGYNFDTLVELGVSFERELVVRSTGEEFSPSTTIFLRAGMTY